MISKEFEHRSRLAGIHPEFVLPNLRADAGPRRHAGRSFRAARRHRGRNPGLGSLSGGRCRLGQRLRSRVNPARPGRLGSDDLSGRRQTQRHLDAAHERARGATLLDGGAPLGAALGSIIIAGLIGEFGSWRVSFVVAGVGTMLCGFFAWRYIRNDPADHPSVNKAEAEYIANAHAHEDSLAPGRVGSGGWGLLPSILSVWCMCLGWMFFNAVFYGLLTWMPNYLSAVHGLDIKQLGGSLFAMFLARRSSASWSGARSPTGGGIRGGRPNTIFRTLFESRRNCNGSFDLRRRLCPGSPRRASCY